MRNITVYIFIVLIGINSCGLDQWFKMPVLFSHYQEHVEKGTTSSVFNFLAMHYLDQDIDDNDYDRDMQLPFKNVSLHVQTIFISNPIITQEFPVRINRVKKRATFWIPMHCERGYSLLLKPPCFS